MQAFCYGIISEWWRNMYNIKKTYLAIVLGGAVLYSKGIIAAPYLLNTQIPLGAVNGRIVNNTVRISKTLAQPTLVNIYRSNIDNGLNFLLIKNAKVIKQSSDEVHIEIKRALP